MEAVDQAAASAAVAAADSKRSASLQRRPYLECVIGIDQDRHRTVIHQVQRHVRLKHARFHANSEGLQRFHEILVKRLTLFGWSGLVEARAALPADVTVEGELRNRENRAASIEQRTIYFALIVIEDAQIHGELRSLTRADHSS